MSGQLEQILGYLDKAGVTEVVVGNGKPVTFRRNQENVGLTKEPLSKAQLGTLIKGTTLYHLVPDRDGTKPSVEITIGTRAVKVTATRKGEEISFRIEAPDPVIELSPEVPSRAKRSTRGVSFTETTRAKRTSIPVPPEPPRRGTRNSIPITTEPVRRSTRNSIPITTEPVRRSTRNSIAVETARTQTKPKRGSKPDLTSDFELDLESSDLESSDLESSDLAVGIPGKAGAGTKTFRGMIEVAQQRRASDLHIATNRPISLRVLGELVPIDASAKPITAAEADALLKPLLAKEHLAQLESSGYVDFALEAAGGGRLRTNVSKFQGGLKGTFRIARLAPATLEELSLPKDLAKLVHHHQGLVVVAGPSGHGKTTTLAALVDLINASRPFHIITVEDPIEIVYPRKAAVVSQREVGPHTRSFAAALKGSLREDPDVIVIGELRDRETVEIALTAAETGHLVIATMSTPNAAKTIDRLVDMFPPEDQSQVRASIAGALRAIVAQRLLPSTHGDRVYAAVEVLTGVLALSAMIREDKLFQLPNLMQRGKAFGMIRFDDSLLELVRGGKITADTAIAASDNKKELGAQLRGGAPTAGSGAAKAPEPAAPPKKGGLGGLFGRKDS